MGRLSEILSNEVETFLELSPTVETHLEDTDNPHAVTKTQVGLGNVSNELQATQSDFTAHCEEAVLAHPNGSVTTGKLASNAVTEGKIAAAAVTAAKIADGAVTADKLATDAVPTAKLTNGAVTADKLAANAVQTAKIADGAVTAAKLAAAVTTSIQNKVDKETGKGLSQNDYTDADKAKLASLEITQDSLEVDLSGYLQTTASAYLSYEGQTFSTGTEENVTSANTPATIEQMETDAQGRMAIGYKGTNGIYYAKVYDADGTNSRAVTGTANTQVMAFYAGDIYLADFDAGTGTISISKNGTPTYTLTDDSQNSTYVRLQQLIITSDRIIILYTNRNGSPDTLYVDSYSRASTPVQAWSKFYWTRDYTVGETDHLYSRMQHMATLDDAGNLYVAPVVSTSLAYAVARITPEGVQDKTYLPLVQTDYTSDVRVLRDIRVRDGYLYGIAKGDVIAIHTETAVVRYYNGMAGEYNNNYRALAFSTDSYGNLYGAWTKGSEGVLLKKWHKGFETPEARLLTDVVYDALRYDETKRKFTALRVEDGAIKRTVITPKIQLTVEN